MCGVGFVISNNQNLINSFCEKINESQLNRGPDNQEYKVYNNLGICHQRLGIIGLDNKFNQPYLHKNNIISFNGEIYNFKLLAKKYSLSKNALLSDTACLIELIELMGIEKTVSLIDGMYSFGIYDINRKKIQLCTDNFGIKQLYFYYSEEITLITSTINAIKDCLESLEIKLSIDQPTLDWQKSFNGSVPGHTHISEIKQLRTNYIYEIDLNEKDKKFKIKNFKKIKYFVYDKKDILDKNLNQASIADVEKGLLLSGGIDSTCLLCCTKNKNTKLESFIIDNTPSESSGFSSQEIEYASHYSESMGIKRNIINKDQISSKDLKEIFKIIDTPAEVTGALALYLICKKIKLKNPGIRVLLSGVGADEIFFGYRGHLLAIFIGIIPKQLQSLFKYLIMILFKIIPKSYASFFRRASVIKNVLDAENSTKDASLHAFAKMDEKSLNRWRECFPLFRTNKNYAVPKLYYERCFDYFLSQQHLPSYDRISMFFSIELRVPFLQNRIKYSNQINGIIDLIYKSITRKNKLKKLIRKKLKTRYQPITKSGFGTYPNILSQDGFDYVNTLIKYGNKNRWINESSRFESSMNLRLFYHLINKAHFVYLLKLINKDKF